MSSTNIENLPKPSKKKQLKIYAEIPKKEKRWVEYTSSNSTSFFVTSNPEVTTYFLWKKEPSGFVMIAKAPMPTDLYKLMEE